MRDPLPPKELAEPRKKNASFFSSSPLPITVESDRDHYTINLSRGDHDAATDEDDGEGKELIPKAALHAQKQEYGLKQECDVQKQYYEAWVDVIVEKLRRYPRTKGFDDAALYKEALTLGNVEKVAKLLRNEIAKDAEVVTWKLLIMAIPPKTTDDFSVMQRKLAKYFSRYGLTHPGLQLGGHILDWNTFSLVRPRVLKTKDFKVHAAADLSFTSLAKYTPKSGVDAFVRQVAVIIVDWNKSKQYNPLSCNCQHFVDAMLEGIDFRPKYPMAIANYLERIKKDHQNARPHIVDPHGTIHYFDTHKDLDIYYNKRKKDYENPLGDAEIRLLKAFDRAFMIQWIAGGQKKGDPAEPEKLLKIKAYKIEKFGCEAFGCLTSH